MTVPYDHGLLDVGDSQHVYWECCGNHHGTPVLMVHGGPGSGCSPAMRDIVNLTRHRLILFDQRGCGRSRPHVTTTSRRELRWLYRGAIRAKGSIQAASQSGLTTVRSDGRQAASIIS